MNRSRPSAVTAAVVTVFITLSLVASACATDGRELRETQAWQTTTTRPSPPTSAPDQQSSPSGFTLSSPMFIPGGLIPETATCAGGNTFPALSWSGVPPLAIELVLNLSDQTDPTMPVLLWQLAGIEPELGFLDAGIIPIGAFETLNGFGNPGFGLPCLENLGLENLGLENLGLENLGPDPVTAGQRDLQFRLYVLTGPSGIAPGEDGQLAWDRVRSSALESASLLARIDIP